MKKKVKYLDPKNDLTFRRIFGEHPHIMKSFLNSLLPLEKGQEIVELSYLEPELIPELPSLKRSIVDVNCIDNKGRQFIVEMQMYWTSAFKQRMLFNGSKAYVRQLKKKEKYTELKTVYGLSLVDDIYLPQYQDVFYHHYKFVHTEINQELIEGLEFVFVELPKFKTRNITDKKMQTLWLRFLTEIDEDTEQIPKDLENNEEIREAIECLQEAAFSEDELMYYNEYWDAIRIEKAALEELTERNEKLIAKIEQAEKEIEQAEKEKEQAEKEKEQAEKEKEQAEKEKEQAMKKLAVKMKKYEEKLDDIIRETGLSKEEIENL